MGTLYIVATPIGNLGDLTIRAIEILQSVSIVACEDTRRTGILLKHIRDTYPKEGVEKPQLISYFDQNEMRRTEELIQILKSGQDVALVSDAGTPLVSDPGYRLVHACVEQQIPMKALPGASSILTALAISGLPSDKFLFLGYPPHKSGHRQKLYESVKNQTVSSTTILFEAPHKLIKTLEEMQEIFGDMHIVIGRELTKIYEEVRREQISQSLDHFKKVAPKGEFVILFHLD